MKLCNRIFLFVLGVCAVDCASLCSAADTVAILPGDFTLHGPFSMQTLVAERQSDAGDMGQAKLGESDVEFASSDETVVKIKRGVATPVGDGEAVITATIHGQTAAVKATVSGMASPPPVSFRHDVLPIFAKAGCNSGACHGALAGKGGFKLSLRGYDPASDHFAITRQARGRRVELSDPGRSLILAKPTAAISHKGGLRLETGSTQYKTIAQWITEGAAPPTDEDAALQRIEVLPSLVTLKTGTSQQFIVLAHYSDGVTKDVTRLTKFTSANEAVAQIDDNGKASVSGKGEGAVSAWFSSKIAIARITSPYENDVQPQVFANAPRRNFIDELTLKQLQRLNLPPSPRATDREFIRRAFIDCIGTLPTPDELNEFLADGSPDKRDKLIEHLLHREEFVDYWTYKWSDVLMINGTLLRPDAVKAYYQWIRGHVEANTRWDQFAREIVTAQGGSTENGATNFYALHQTAEDMSENVSQAFMGLSIACAKCHNHPLEKWSNDQYYAMANMFSRVRAKGWGGDTRNGDGLRTLYVANHGELIQPLTGKPQPPTPLDGEPVPFDDATDRRVHLAAWLTAPDNPYFARSITNRIWGNYFGVGLVEQVDDMRVSNPASNEELLAAAASHLVENKFDVKALMRTIMQSETYQRSSQPLPENAAEKRFYARYYPRRMIAEVMLDAISQATSVPTAFTQVVFPGADKRATDFYPTGTRAIELYDSAVESYFLQTFGRNQRRITCECERSNEPSMVQVLHLSNGDTINKKLQAKDNRITQLLASDMTDAEIIHEAYLVTLSRPPTDEELKPLLAEFASAEENERRVLVEDLFWALLSTREFIFNH